MRILVAEDNVVNRELVRHILTQLGHAVVMAHTGQEVIERHAEQPFDLILMDYWMPDMGGLEACTEIRKREATSGRKTPIIALTGHAVKGDLDACLAAGMDDYLIKPVRRESLLAAIQRVVGNQDRPTAQSVVKNLLEPWEGIDGEILYKLGSMMVESTNTSLADLRTALVAGDWTLLQREAHTLKGSLGLFHAPLVVGTARQLEDAARRSDGAAAERILQALTNEVAAVQVEVRERCAAGPPSQH